MPVPSDPTALPGGIGPTGAPPGGPAHLRGVTSGARILLSAFPFRIGRDPACALRVRDPHVSRVHAEILREGDAYVLYDRSTNGTLVNGRRVESGHVLAHGDLITVGAEGFVFLCGTGAEPEPPTPARPVPDAVTLGAAARTAVRPRADVRPGSWSRALRALGLVVAAGLLVLLWLVLRGS
jgi:pSer/pThr/pTyr-binding forkhead associated (FHA) protein